MSNDRKEQNLSPIDENLLELIETRISKRVSENVEKGLRWRYGLVAAAIIGIVGFLGWNIKTSIDSHIGFAVTQVKEDLDKTINELEKEAEDAIQNARVSVEVTAVQQGRTGKLMDQIEKSINEFQKKLPVIERLTENFNELEDQRKRIQVRLEEANYKVIALQGTAEKLAELANQVEKLSNIISRQNPKASKISTDIKTIEKISRASADAVKKTEERITVFLQFAGPPRRQVEAISEALSKKNYAIPGEERVEMASNIREVRYFHEADRTAALNLAKDTEAVLAELKYTEQNVKVLILTAWTGKKPKPGVLELWLSLPDQAEKKPHDLLKIYKIKCLDPQSNPPKKCDKVYLKVNGRKLWRKSLKICRGDRLKLSDKIYFDDQTIIELWEDDALKDDLLGQFKVIDKLNNSEGLANISGSNDKGDWNYAIRFHLLK